MSYRVFISYSHQDTPLRLALALAIEKVSGTTVLYDTREIPYTKEIHASIAHMIALSDCVVAIYSQASLASPEVKDEVDQAVNLNKTILPVVDIDVKTRLPFSVRDKKAVEYTCTRFDETTAKVQEVIQNFAYNSKSERTDEASPEQERGKASGSLPGVGDLPEAGDCSPFVLMTKGPLETEFGEFLVSLFHDGSEQAIALSKGDLYGQSGVLCRIHSECLTSHMFFGKECDCKEQMKNSQRRISTAGAGLIIFLHQEGRGNGAAAHVATLSLKRRGVSQNDAYRMVGFPEDNRRYGMAAKIIRHFGIQSVRLITSSKQKQEDLRGLGVAVDELTYHSGRVVQLGRGLRNLAADVAERRSESPVPKTERKRVFVIGDLNIDYCLPVENIRGGRILDRPLPLVGGTGYNAALALKATTFEPIVFGKVGDDIDGHLIIEELAKQEFTSLVGIHDSKRTGTATMLFLPDSERCLLQEPDSANDYDHENLSQALQLASLGKGDIIFFVAHPFARFDVPSNKKLVATLGATSASIILDVVPHNMYDRLDLRDFKTITGDAVHVLIGEFSTLMRLSGRRQDHADPKIDDIKALFSDFGVRALVLRYGAGNIDKQDIWLGNGASPVPLEKGRSTGYQTLRPGEKRGFGDRLTAELLNRHRDALTAL